MAYHIRQIAIAHTPLCTEIFCDPPQSAERLRSLVMRPTFGDHVLCPKSSLIVDLCFQTLILDDKILFQSYWFKFIELWLSLSLYFSIITDSVVKLFLLLTIYCKHGGKFKSCANFGKPYNNFIHPISVDI